jgi:hypothetical protein
MAVEARRCETETTAVLVRLEEENGQGGPRGLKRPNRPVGWLDRLGRN